MQRDSESFDFVASGRSYSCRVEQPNATRPDAWWWFDVAGDRGRYAPFRAEPDDTESSVRARIVSYYEAHLERRGWRTGRPV